MAEASSGEREEDPSVNGLPEEEEEEGKLKQIEPYLDTLTYSGSTINDLELKLMQARAVYRRTVAEGRQRLETLRKKLQTHITKSEPFVEVWRRARQVQDASNRAAMNYDKANSQHAAAKEMICVAEQQLGTRVVEPGSPSALDLAWQEMLNHATSKVVETERERRDSEVEHLAALKECQKVMMGYTETEKRLRSHIIKSRPYYEERFRAYQSVQQLKQHMQSLEKKISESKRVYANTLNRLEALNMAIHARRRSSTLTANSLAKVVQNDRKTASAGNTPPMRLRGVNGASDTESLDSLRLGDMRQQFTGSTGSLPSIGTSSVSDFCPTPEPTGEGCEVEQRPIQNGVTGDSSAEKAGNASSSKDSGAHPSSGDVPVITVQSEEQARVSDVAQELVRQSLEKAVEKLQLENSRAPHLPLQDSNDC